MELDKSLDRILERTDAELAKHFYDTVLANHDDIAAFFDGVDMWYQSAILTIGLQTVVRYYRFRGKMQRRFLVALGHLHYTLRIPKSLYPKFIDSLVASIKMFSEEDWNEEVEQQWREALDLGVDTMFEGYVEELPIVD
ncbi:hypothetical protein Pan216_24790 [Planctomycetes bacterium Pan216]|uniref:Globin domain-containing protein n=1 Tax=Kolteria novifilia TaxID=2527975 RepID=A0A518B3P2_9BACT|nr:hypothetical protein Pan216_24790 [Planctomycetes bacterium Pan216]